MRIIIMDYSNKNAWYKDKVGSRFNLISQDVNYYYVKEKNSVLKVLKRDAEII